MTTITLSRSDFPLPIKQSCKGVHPELLAIEEIFNPKAKREISPVEVSLSATKTRQLYKHLQRYIATYSQQNIIGRFGLEQSRLQLELAVLTHLNSKAGLASPVIEPQPSPFKQVCFWVTVPLMLCFASCDGFCGAMAILETLLPIHAWLAIPASLFSAVAMLIIVGFDLREISLYENINFLKIPSFVTLHYQQQIVLEQAILTLIDLVTQKNHVDAKFLREAKSLQKLLVAMATGLSEHHKKYSTELVEPKLIQLAKIAVTVVASVFHFSSGLFIGKGAATYYLALSGASLMTSGAAIFTVGLGMICGAGVVIGFLWLQRRG